MANMQAGYQRTTKIPW